MQRLEGLTADLREQLLADRRHLHRNPELSNDERQTQAYIEERLVAEGMHGHRRVAGYGVTLDITGERGNSNRKVAVRADIDALPIIEDSGVAFTSANSGVMHACGHDAHTAMVLAAASHLHRNRHQFSGTVRIIFQPAEEAEPLGGRRIVEEGLLDDVDAAIGIHVDPYLDAGMIAVAPGPYTLASDIFDLVVTGVAAHAAKPSDGVDAITAACAIVGEVQKIVSRESDAYEPLVVSITGIEGGGSYNIVADEVRLKGTIRSGSLATRRRAQDRLKEIVSGLAIAHRVTARLSFIDGEPPVVNDPELAGIVRAAAARLLGDGKAVAGTGWTAADDFGFYCEKVPSVYFRLGIRNEAEGATYPLHHPKFRIDESVLPLGAEMIIESALQAVSAE